MANVEDFGKKLFTVLANKLIHEENLDSSEEKLDISKKNLGPTEENLKYSHSNDDVSCSILMLSYAYRPIFIERFQRVHSILMRAERNPVIYVRCFAEASHKKYSPLKFLIVCSFISEIYVYLSKHRNSKKKHCYVQQTTEALNDVYQSIFEKDFPQNGWIDIQNEASKLAKGYQFLEPFMDSEISNITACDVADAILTGNYKSENEDQQTDVTMAGTTSQEMVSVNTLSVPNSQVLIPVNEVPFLSSDGLSTNQNTSLAPNLVYIPEFPYSFGTVDQNPHLLYLLRVQTEVVTFENQPSGIEQNFQEVVEIVEPSNIELKARETAIISLDEPESSFRTVELSNIESQAEENLIARSSGDGPLSSFQTAEPSNIESQAQENLIARSSGNELVSPFQKAEPSNIESQAQGNLIARSSGNEPVSSFQKAEPSNIESQAQENLIARSSEDEPLSSFRTVKLTESGERETCPAGSQAISEQELIHGEEQFWKYVFSSVSEDESTVKETENLEREGCTADNVVIPEQELMDSDGQFGKNNLYSSSKIESTGDTTEGGSQDYKENDDCRIETLSKENDLESETFSNEENTLTGGNTVNFTESQSETFSRRQSYAAFQDFVANKAVSSQKINARQAIEIEINFTTEGNALSAKVLHLNLDGKKFLVRMPEGMSLIFKYDGRTSSSKQPQI